MIKGWIKYAAVAGILGLIFIFTGLFFTPLIGAGILLWISIPFFPIMRMVNPKYFEKRGL